MSKQQHRPPASNVVLRRGVKALISTADRVLLVEESHSDGSRFWTLPGGGVEPEESVVRALTRELYEELRCRASVGSRQGEFWYAHVSTPDMLTWYTVFECALSSQPVPNAAEGLLDAQWRCRSDLPPETLVGVRQIVEQTAPGYTGRQSV